MKGLPKVPGVRPGSLRQVDAQALDSVLAAASDIVLALDEAGVIRDITLGQLEYPLAESGDWIGQGWEDTVTPASRTMVQEMLRDASADGVSRRRQVAHPSPSGGDIPVAYTVIRPGRGADGLVAVGRDLRAVSVLEQRLVEAQQSLQRDYTRTRQIEMLYRLLFQASTEPLLMLDAATRKVVDASPSAAELFGQPAKQLVGRTFPFDFDRQSDSVIADTFTALRARGEADPSPVRLAAGGRAMTLAASLVQQAATALFVVRLMPDGSDVRSVPSGPGTSAVLAQVIDRLPDGVMLLDAEGRILAANRAFLDLIGVPTEEQVRHELLSRWLGRPGADLGRLLATVREQGAIRLFGTSLQGEFGLSSEVEVSGVSINAGGRVAVVMLLRDVSRRLASGPRGASDLTRAVEQLTALVGRVSLKNLVRDTTDLVERHFVEAALDTTRDNRTQAAEVLGISRQSLYVKLRRYQLGTPSAEDDPGRQVRKSRAAGKQKH